MIILSAILLLIGMFAGLTALYLIEGEIIKNEDLS